MKTFRLLLSLLLGAAGFQAAAAVNELALPEKLFPELDSILATAVQQSPRMLNRALDLEIAENNRIAARAGLLPSISASASYYKSEDRQTYLYPNHVSAVSSYKVTKTPYSVGLNQPLYYWGERSNGARIGEIQEKIAQGQYREGYRLLTQELRLAYLRLITQKIALKRSRFYLELATNTLGQQEERWNKKVISDADIAMARLATERAQIALDQGEFDFQNAKASFARLSGTTVMSDETIPESIPSMVHEAKAFEVMLAGFLAQKDPPSMEAATLRQTMEVEKLNYDIAKTRLYPKVNFALGVSQDQQNNLYGTIDSYTTTSLYAGISVSWTIFDGFAAGAAERNSLARRRQMEGDYRVLTERLAQDAQTQVKQAGFSARNMSIADRQLVNSEGALKSTEENFQRKTKSEADVSQSRLSLFDAQLAAANARTEYLSRTGDFLGMIMEDPVLAKVASSK